MEKPRKRLQPKTLMDNAPAEQESIQKELTVQVQRLGLSSSSLMKLAALTGVGLLGRVALQWVPSVEPLVPLSIAVSFFLGYKYGLPSGMASFYASNFLVWGGQGPWTLFQVLGTGAAALIGSGFGKISKSKYSLAAAAAIGTLAYDLIADLSFAFFGFFSPFLLFVLPLPFTAVHIASSVGFAMVIYGFKDKIGGLMDELEVCLRGIGRHTHRSGVDGGKPVDRTVRVFARWRLRKGKD